MTEDLEDTAERDFPNGVEAAISLARADVAARVGPWRTTRALLAELARLRAVEKMAQHAVRHESRFALQAMSRVLDVVDRQRGPSPSQPQAEPDLGVGAQEQLLSIATDIESQHALGASILRLIAEDVRVMAEGLQAVAVDDDDQDYLTVTPQQVADAVARALGTDDRPTDAEFHALREAVASCRGHDCGREGCASCTAMRAYYERLDPAPEVECPSCGATIRARLADAPAPMQLRVVEDDPTRPWSTWRALAEFEQAERVAEGAPSDEEVARAFHEVYERLAPQFGYRTREASAKPWAEVPEANRALMVATVHEVRLLMAEEW